MKNNGDQQFGSVEAASKVGISTERLRYWETRGIVKPTYIQSGTRKFRRFSFQDIKRAKFVRELVDKEKYTLEGAMIKLTGEMGFN